MDRLANHNTRIQGKDAPKLAADQELVNKHIVRLQDNNEHNLDIRMQDGFSEGIVPSITDIPAFNVEVLEEYVPDTIRVRAGVGYRKINGKLERIAIVNEREQYDARNPLNQSWNDTRMVDTPKSTGCYNIALPKLESGVFSVGIRYLYCCDNYDRVKGELDNFSVRTELTNETDINLKGGERLFYKWVDGYEIVVGLENEFNTKYNYNPEDNTIDGGWYIGSVKKYMNEVIVEKNKEVQLDKTSVSGVKRLGTDTVYKDKIRDGAITGAKFQDNGILLNNKAIADGSIEGSKFSSSEEDSLRALDDSKFSGSVITARTLNVDIAGKGLIKSEDGALSVNCDNITIEQQNGVLEAKIRSPFLTNGVISTNSNFSGGGVYRYPAASYGTTKNMYIDLAGDISVNLATKRIANGGLSSLDRRTNQELNFHVNVGLPNEWMSIFWNEDTKHYELARMENCLIQERIPENPIILSDKVYFFSRANNEWGYKVEGGLYTTNIRTLTNYSNRTFNAITYINNTFIMSCQDTDILLESKDSSLKEWATSNRVVFDEKNQVKAFASSPSVSVAVGLNGISRQQGASKWGNVKSLREAQWGNQWMAGARLWIWGEYENMYWDWGWQFDYADAWSSVLTQWNDVCWTGKKFIAVGNRVGGTNSHPSANHKRWTRYTNFAVSDANGDYWSFRDSSVFGNITKIASSDKEETIVIAGNSGTIGVSRDGGKTWTSKVLSNDVNFKVASLCFGNGQFILTTNTGKVWMSYITAQEWFNVPVSGDPWEGTAIQMVYAAEIDAFAGVGLNGKFAVIQGIIPTGTQPPVYTYPPPPPLPDPLVGVSFSSIKFQKTSDGLVFLLGGNKGTLVLVKVRIGGDAYALAVPMIKLLDFQISNNGTSLVNIVPVKPNVFLTEGDQEEISSWGYLNGGYTDINAGVTATNSIFPYPAINNESSAPARTTKKAFSDGHFVWRAACPDNGQVGCLRIVVNDTLYYSSQAPAGYLCGLTVPVRKGDIIKCYCNFNWWTRKDISPYFSFIFAREDLGTLPDQKMFGGLA